MFYEIGLLRLCLLLDGDWHRNNLIIEVSFSSVWEFFISLKVGVISFSFLTSNNLTQTWLNFWYFELSKKLTLILCFEVFYEDFHVRSFYFKVVIEHPSQLTFTYPLPLSPKLAKRLQCFTCSSYLMLNNLITQLTKRSCYSIWFAVCIGGWQTFLLLYFSNRINQLFAVDIESIFLQVFLLFKWNQTVVEKPEL